MRRFGGTLFIFALFAFGFSTSIFLTLAEPPENTSNAQPSILGKLNPIWRKRVKARLGQYRILPNGEMVDAFRYLQLRDFEQLDQNWAKAKEKGLFHPALDSIRKAPFSMTSEEVGEMPFLFEPVEVGMNWPAEWLVVWPTLVKAKKENVYRYGRWSYVNVDSYHYVVDFSPTNRIVGEIAAVQILDELSLLARMQMQPLEIQQELNSISCKTIAASDQMPWTPKELEPVLAKVNFERPHGLVPGGLLRSVGILVPTEEFVYQPVIGMPKTVKGFRFVSAEDLPTVDENAALLAIKDGRLNFVDYDTVKRDKGTHHGKWVRNVLKLQFEK